MTIGEKKSEILNRPGFKSIDDSTKLASIITDCIKKGELKLYTKYRLVRNHYEKQNIIPSLALALPTGENFSANGKLYRYHSASTPVLPTDIAIIKKLAVLKGATDYAPTFSNSGYDTDETEATGLPTDLASYTTSTIEHELVNEGASAELLVYAGSTLVNGTGDKCGMIYVRTISTAATDGTSIDVPDDLLIQGAEFDEVLDELLSEALADLRDTL
jgi:hypothetical protein